MKIYVNNQYEILSLDKEPSSFYDVFDIDHTREEMFGNLCDSVIQCYKYEPNFELLFNEDGSNARDEKTGEILYKLKDDGKKIFQGYVYYPFVDNRTLMLIQKQYEESKKLAQVSNAKIEYLFMMSGIDMGVVNCEHV